MVSEFCLHIVQQNTPCWLNSLYCTYRVGSNGEVPAPIHDSSARHGGSLGGSETPVFVVVGEDFGNCWRALAFEVDARSSCENFPGSGDRVDFVRPSDPNGVSHVDPGDRAEVHHGIRIRSSICNVVAVVCGLFVSGVSNGCKNWWGLTLSNH